MKATELRNSINEGGKDKALTALYGESAVQVQKERYSRLIENYINLYGNNDVLLFSVPGRTEISGNHTDHNSGKVIAGAVNLDIIAVASKTDDGVIRIKSEGYREDCVNLSDIESYRKKGGSSSAIIAGICDGLVKSGRKCGGFCAYTTSSVLTGSGLSSSAAFEVACAIIQSYFYNQNSLSAIDMAKLGKYAENEFFGKPCGLMDQAACAAGGFLYIDFENPEFPVLEKQEFSLSGNGYSLCITNCGGSHADLTADYASIPAEMFSCAALMGKKTLRECDFEDFLSRIKYLREVVGDRPILRALHYFCENNRVEKQREALRNGDTSAFLRLVNDSGNSSYKYLQNVYTIADNFKQPLALALAVSDNFGAFCRVHGGGFAGTILAFVPTEKTCEYAELMNSVFGDGACMPLSIRQYGACVITDGDIISPETA